MRRCKQCGDDIKEPSKSEYCEFHSWLEIYDKEQYENKTGIF